MKGFYKNNKNNEMDFNKNNNGIKKYIIFLLIALILSVIVFIMYRYHVEGESNLPFNITKIMVISSAETEELELNDNLYQANIIQKNDVYVAIEKNEKYKKQDAIKKITFNNFNIIKKGNIGQIKIYRMSLDETNFEYKEEYEINDSLEFVGDLNTNLKMEKMTIANQGGLLEFSLVLNDLGKITYGENENIPSDGTLLNRLNIKKEDVETKVAFDMTIELSSGNTFKTTITLDLPVGDIVTDGVCTEENMDLNKLVFKRI